MLFKYNFQLVDEFNVRVSLFMHRHVVYAPSMLDSYSDVVFPGVVDTLQKATVSGSAIDWSAVARQIAAATSAIEAAGASLRDVIVFMKASWDEI